MRPLSVLLPLLLLATGCGGGPYPVAAVSGRVTLNGQPLAGAGVVFQPVAASGSQPGPGSTGVTDKDGRYTLRLTGKESKGAVVGKHTVRITMMPESDSAEDRPKSAKRPKPLPQRYNLKTTLEFDVPAGGTDAADFPLTAP
jgi:hypothetical protein